VKSLPSSIWLYSVGWVYCRGDEPICYRGSLCHLPLCWGSWSHNFLVILWNLLKTKKLFMFRAFMFRVWKNCSCFKCFAGRTTSVWGPQHVRHRWST